MVEVRRTSEYVKWFSRIRDVNARARITLRIRRITLTGNLGDARSVGDGVHELRVDYGPGYRLYFSKRGAEIILLLLGGDKSSQQRDIAKAKRLNRRYE